MTSIISSFSMKNVILKLLFFGAITMLVGIGGRYGILQYISHKYSSAIFNKKINPQCIFIGNSRVNAALDDSLFASKIHDFEIHNYAIWGVPFNYTLKIIEKLSAQTSNSVFYIELSQMHTTLHFMTYSLLNIEEQTDATLNFYRNYNINTFNQAKTLVYESTNLLHTVIASSKYYNTLRGNIQYDHAPKHSELTEIYKGPTYIIANQNDYNNNIDSTLSKQYISLINKHIKLFDLNKNKLYFMLPVTFNTNAERISITNIFNQIPNSNKVVYSQKFFKAINNRNNLNDRMHLNTQGSIIFTNEMIEQFKNRH